MSDTYRHHRAHAGGPADMRIIFVPIEIGSPKEANRQRPRPYPVNRREAWRPAQHPPSRAERTARFLRNVIGQESAVREFMRSAREESRHAN
jgi:hypothetical protein